MNLNEVEEQISEMFANVPIGLLSTVKGFIVILHGDSGNMINMSNEILNATLDEKKIIIVSLLQKIIDNPTELLNLLSFEGV